MKVAEHACPDCGAKLLSNAPGGLCPRCLLQLGLGRESPAEHGEFVSDRTSGRSPEFRRDDTRSMPGNGDRQHVSGVLSDLDDVIGSVPRVLLRDGTDGDSRVLKSGVAQIPELTCDAGRYQLLGEIARGGIGAVLQGRDIDLGRDLAIKVLLERHRDHPEMVRRFVEEAQIGGQLQHPGIVPVYELGQFPDRRLYIAMKLVRGRTLAAILESRGSPADDRPRFLWIFEQVCQTMAYAHARGVLHRDLKPSNIMVGSFGEVQVMDWGLAKVIEQGGVADEERAHRIRDNADTIRTLRSGSDAGESRAGSVLGTPAYMAPEQARGLLDTLDERADVFSLGSILCEILTGQPAFTGRSVEGLYRKAERAELGDAIARLTDCGADGELVALARSCLAAAPKDRPRDAGVVTTNLTAYLAGVEERVHAAELAQAKAEARAAGERKRRLLAVSLAASILSLVLISWGGWFWTTREYANRAKATDIAVTEFLSEAILKREEARAERGRDPSKWVEAVEAAKRAEALANGSAEGAELRARVQFVLADISRERDAVGAVDKDHKTVERLAQIHNDLGVHFDMDTVEAEYSAAFRAYGVDVDALEPAEAGERLKASKIAVQLANALDQWAFIRKREGPRFRPEASRLVAIAKIADPDDWRNKLRDTLEHKTGNKNELGILEELAANADPKTLPEASVTRLAMALSAVGSRDMAISLLRQTQRVHPGDFWINCDLGRELLYIDSPEEASRFFSVAVAIRPQSSFAVGQLSESFRASGRLDEAIGSLRESIRLQRDVAGAHIGDIARAHIGIAALRLQLGEKEEAQSELLAAKELDPSDVRLRLEIVDLFKNRGEWETAINELRTLERLNPDECLVRDRLGFALLETGRTDAAVDAFKQAIRLDPKFGPAYQNLGRALLVRGDFDEALKVISSTPRPPRSFHPPFPHWHAPRDPRHEAERLILLDNRLPALLRSEKHDCNPKEAADFARLCGRKRQFATSARLWAEAFAAEPAVDREPRGESRYFDAASSAIRAGCGTGHDEPRPGEKARGQLRAQALGWLRTELAACADRLRKGSFHDRGAIPRWLGRWQVDPSFASVRDEKELSTVPEAERADWSALWSEVKTMKEQAKKYVELPPLRGRP